MSHYKPYPAYKDSGVEWIGEVPELWEVKRLRHVATLNPTPDWRELERQQAEYPFLPMEAIGEVGELDTSRRKSLDESRSGYTYFANGDVAYAKVTPCFENGKGTVIKGLEGGHGFGTTELTVLRPHAIDRDFLYALTYAESFRRPGASEMLGSGGLKRVPDEFARNYRAAIPPPAEQSAIVAALDRETARIDALIARKTRFIELLKEKRHALIIRAVTKGLDPKVKMKDSGVEWIGQVPQHWEIKRLKWMLSRRKEKNDPVQTRDILSLTIAQGLVPLAEKEGVGGNLPKDDLSAYDIARPGDLVINSMNVIVGAVGLSRYFGAISPVYYAMFPTLGATSIDYYHHLFRSSVFQESLSVLGDGILVKKSESSGKLNTIRLKISFETLGDQFIPVPPSNEQAAIASTLDREASRIDLLAKTTERSIALLKERRSALITAAVTGQIDLREVA